MYHYYYIEFTKGIRRYLSKRVMEIIEENETVAREKVKESLEQQYPEYANLYIHYLGATISRRYYDQGLVENYSKNLEVKSVSKDYVPKFPLKSRRLFRFVDIEGQKRRITLSGNFKICFEEYSDTEWELYKLEEDILTWVCTVSLEEKEKIQSEVKKWGESQKHNS